MIYRFGDCKLDTERQELRRAGQRVAVEPKAFAVLVYLLQHCDRVVTKAELLEQCWQETYVSEAALSRCLTKVRKAIGVDRTGAPMIQTVHRKGYRCVVAVETYPPAFMPSPLALSAVDTTIFPAAPEAINLPEATALPNETSPALSPAADPPAGLAGGPVCPQCQTPNRVTRQFCAACGDELWQLCPQCGFRNSAAERFCGGCGIGAVSSMPASPSIRTGPPRAYTPAHLTSRILTSQSGLLGERKLVTVLVARIEGLQPLHQAYDADEVDTVLNRGFARLVAEAHRVEGFVAQVAGHGITVLFGVPLTCEDHVLRALHAALGMQRAFTAFAGDVQQSHSVALTLQCGVHTGPVLVGEIDQELQLTYTAPGATVQVATALQQLSQGSAIVVSATVQQQATGFFRFALQGLQSLPEVPEPVRIYICTGVGAVTSRLEGALARGRTAFHGRQQELALLATCWARVCQGTGQVVCVIGEAGVGKSRLAYECRRTSGGARWLTMQALSYAQAMPYQAFLPLLRTLLGIAETDDPAHQRQAIRTHLLHLSPALPDVAPLLMHVLGVPLESEALPALSPEAQRRRLLHACEQLILQQTSPHPLFLLVEDGHWLDPSSRALLDALVASLARRSLLVLCTARPGFRHTWADYTYFHRVTVEPLAAEETDALVRDLLRPYDASTTLQALIRQRTGGNPFFVEELVRAMQAHALLTLRGTVYELTTDRHLTLPASVQGIVQARLDRLPAEEKHLLQVASVIGPEVSLPLLQGLTELPEDALHRHMKRLQTAELLYEIPTEPLPVYTFRNGD